MRQVAIARTWGARESAVTSSARPHGQGNRQPHWRCDRSSRRCWRVLLSRPSSHAPYHPDGSTRPSQVSEAEGASCSAWLGVREAQSHQPMHRGAPVCPTNPSTETPRGNDRCSCSWGSRPENGPQDQELDGKLGTCRPQGQRTGMARAPPHHSTAGSPARPAQIEAGVPSLSPEA